MMAKMFYTLEETKAALGKRARMKSSSSPAKAACGNSVTVRV